ncbi:nucleotide-diphospho-sugar transferase [Schizophyllum amplum]|uniref:Translation initiation factor eIF2B subunit epsilon n=1 Tax=Schizophyllum amplum TaxID=97359 RepID=A0A550CAS7_9AGAR|nr:nucleotide-diphospho-sugar transferase [Auriculariopsis ampla]
MSRRNAGSGKDKLLDDEDEVLQAVILADSFNKRFRPLTTRKPRCLLPMCNAPLLDWTFESLALAGVQEVFVVCRSHAEQVKTAISESKWSKPGSGMKIVPIMTAKETFSPGDAMRDIYTRGLVTSDFVLVMGDLVSNIRIDEVVRVHKERRKTNKDAIMTMVVKESGSRHRTRMKGDSSVFVLDPETSECVHYEHVAGYPLKKTARIPREVLSAHQELEIRNDLIDCHIDVCSVEVPSLFQDNFDYSDIRRDFVHGVLTSDLLMKNIHCYVAKDGYAARVKDTKSYEAVSKDILARWTFPLVPDDNHPSGHVYEHLRGNKYIAKDNTVTLARNCKIGNNTLIGSSSQVGDGAEITASVIGCKCIIGPGCKIRDAYIFDGSVIGAGCVIERSILGAGVQIKEGSQIDRGCLVADDVTVGPQAHLKPFERLSRRRDSPASASTPEEDDDEVDSDLEEVEAMQDSLHATLGKDSNAIVWPREEPEEEEQSDVDDDEYNVENPRNQRFMRLADDCWDLEVSDEGTDSDDEDSDSSSDDESTFSVPTNASQTSLPVVEKAAEHEFQKEVAQSLERAFAEGHSVDNAAVELKTLRMASNVPLIRVRESVVGAIVERIPIVAGDPAGQRRAIAQVIGRWGDLINQIGGMDAVETVTVLQQHCAGSERMPLFGQILAALYQEDVVEEDDIRAWYKSPLSRGEGVEDTAKVEDIKKCWAVGGKMIQQFDAQGSDESSEEESEEGDDEDDEDDDDTKVPSKPTPEVKRTSTTSPAPLVGATASAPPSSAPPAPSAVASTAASSSSVLPAARTPAATAPTAPDPPAGSFRAQRTANTQSSDEDDEGNDDGESEDGVLVESPAQPTKPAAPSSSAAVKAAAESSDEDEEEDEDSEENEAIGTPTTKAVTSSTPAPAPQA